MAWGYGLDVNRPEVIFLKKRMEKWSYNTLFKFLEVAEWDDFEYFMRELIREKAGKDSCCPFCATNRELVPLRIDNGIAFCDKCHEYFQVFDDKGYIELGWLD